MSKYDVVVSRTIADVTALRVDWEKFESSLSSNIDYFITVVSHIDDVICPYVISIKYKREVVALLVARIENVELSEKFAYFNVFRGRFKILTVVYEGILGSHSENILDLLLEHIQKILDEGEVDAVRFSPTNVNSDFYKSIRKKATAFFRMESEEPIIHWKFNLPQNIDEVLRMRSSRSRKRIRYYRKQFESTFGDSISFRVYEKIDDIDMISESMEAVARTTYQRSMNTGFINNPLWKSLLKLGSEKKWIKIYLLFIDSRPIAYGFGFRYAGQFLYFIPAYDPGYSQYGVGNYILINMFEDLIKDNDIQVFDYGFGDAEYKRSFSTHHCYESGITIFSKSAKSIRYVLLSKSLSLVAQLFRGLARHFNIEQFIKTTLRKRLRKRPTE